MAGADDVDGLAHSRQAPQPSPEFRDWRHPCFVRTACRDPGEGRRGRRAERQKRERKRVGGGWDGRGKGQERQLNGCRASGAAGQKAQRRKRERRRREGPQE